MDSFFPPPSLNQLDPSSRPIQWEDPSTQNPLQGIYSKTAEDSTASLLPSKSADSFPTFDEKSPDFEDFRNIMIDTEGNLDQLLEGGKMDFESTAQKTLDPPQQSANTDKSYTPPPTDVKLEVPEKNVDHSTQEGAGDMEGTSPREEEDLSKAFSPVKDFKEDSDEELIIRRKRPPTQPENRKDSESEFQASSSELEEKSDRSAHNSESEYEPDDDLPPLKKQLPPKKRHPVASSWVTSEYRRSARASKPVQRQGVGRKRDSSYEDDDDEYSSAFSGEVSRSGGSSYYTATESSPSYSEQESSTESDLSFLPKRRKGARGRQDGSDVFVSKRRKKMSYSDSSSAESLTLKKFRHSAANKRMRTFVREISKHTSDLSEGSDDVIRPDTSPMRSSRRAARGVTYKEVSESEHSQTGGVLGEENSAGSRGEGEMDLMEENVEAIEKVLQHREGATGREYLIKWANKSHIHNTWDLEEWLLTGEVKGAKKVHVYNQKCVEEREWARNATPEELEDQQLQQEMQHEILDSYQSVERVISVKRLDSTAGEAGGREFLCKWEGLPYADSTWEEEARISDKFQHTIDDYFKRQNLTNVPHRSAKVSKNRPSFKPIPSQPSWLGTPAQNPQTGDSTPLVPPPAPLLLRDYQLEGLNWLVYSWCRHNSVILADEMGLGKTIQTIAFLYYLHKVHMLYGPFLIVVRLSTLSGWQREFAQWASELNIVVYIGDAHSRAMIKQYEWENEAGKIQFNVLVTTYEILLRDKEALGELNWAVLAVDEGHRLKNDDSMVYQALMEFSTHFRMCITGTPLQNSLRELWCLLHFTQAERFPKWEEFQKHHNAYDEGDASGLNQLHAELQPYLLRRVKKDVEKSLPSKVERILTVEMSALQREYYRHILTRNFKALTQSTRVKTHRSSFINILMELQKCCNHAHLTVSVEEDEKIRNEARLQQILTGSGKMVLLDKLLTRMKERGHRVLIFSQMVRMLDIISDYLQLKHWQHQRLDGSIKREDRQNALDHFNADNSTDFCFLLSTKAGGLGINLATADTVVIYDSDWNPQNDLQAQARAHRIGQKKQVNIYRLVTKNSIEVNIIERAKRKMVLDHLVIQRMDTTGRRVLSNSEGGHNTQVPFSKDELDALLKFGAEEIFREDGEQDKRLQEMDIDAIINQAETATMEPTHSSKAEELLSQFKISNFASLGIENEEHKSPEKSARRSTTKSYSDYPLDAPVNLKTWDEIIPKHYLDDGSDEESNQEDQFVFLDHRTRRARKNVRYKETIAQLPPAMQSKQTGSKHAKSSSKSRKDRKSGYVNSDEEVLELEADSFEDSEIRRFIKSYSKFPKPESRLEAIAQDADLVDRSKVELNFLVDAISEGCRETGSKNGLFQIGGVLVSAKSVMKRTAELENLAGAIPKEDPLSFRAGKLVRPPDWGFIRWTSVEDSMLLVGISLHGFGNWQALKADKQLKLSGILPKNPNSRPQASHLKTRAESLLKNLSRAKAMKRSSISNSSKSRSRVKKKSLSTKEKLEIKIQLKQLEHVPDSVSALNEDESNSDSGSETSGKMDVDTFEDCKRILKPVKKPLNKLERAYASAGKKSRSGVPSTSSLLEIGSEIDKYAKVHKHDDDVDDMRRNLWEFVALFTPVTSKELMSHYKKHTHSKSQKKQPSSKSRSDKSKIRKRPKSRDSERTKTGAKRRRK